MRIIGVALLCAIGCSRTAPADTDTARPAMTFAQGRLRIVSGIDTSAWQVELADSQEQQTMGLMEREHLAPDAGMLFRYGSSQPDDAGFWMYRTRIPLDIAFADSLGVIRTVLRMEPCTATLPAGCQSYLPGTRYQYALEVNAGALATKKIGVGSRLLLGDLGAAPAGR